MANYKNLSRKHPYMCPQCQKKDPKNSKQQKTTSNREIQSKTSFKSDKDIQPGHLLRKPLPYHPWLAMLALRLPFLLSTVARRQCARAGQYSVVVMVVSARLFGY